MNIHQIPSDQSPYADYLKAQAKAREERKRQAARRVATANQNAPVVKREPEPRDLESFRITKRPAKKLPLWQEREITFDAHETAWKLWRADALAANGSPLKAYIRRRAQDFGLSYADVIGPSRKRVVAHARQLIMWEIKTIVRPGNKQGDRDYVSYPEIGRLFGGRDHSTVLHAVRSVESTIRERSK